MHERQDRLREKDENATKVKLAEIAAGIDPNAAKAQMTHDIVGGATAVLGDVTSVLTGGKIGGHVGPPSPPPPPKESGPFGIPIIGWVIGAVVVVFVFIMPKKK